MTIELLMIVGLVAGLIAGAVVSNPKIGCAVLLVVPVAMIVYIAIWQNQHPENLRSTSSLDFLFGPLWPSIGAVAGFIAAKVLRSVVGRK